uniref:5'-3' DNA helicase ZGRF1-like N-terminal domain-containing protein n=1 Tax=Lactuca sativa TaxID=4236 RepID=A0A9R1XRD2_LACSA|nr:hypothetical protein LSAT_V11C300117610 [Lactuca sativa]
MATGGVFFRNSHLVCIASCNSSSIDEIDVPYIQLSLPDVVWISNFRNIRLVKLYDDCDKLLDSKIVKLDDDVKAHMSNSKTSKVSSRIGKTSSINLSPSQKIIRGYLYYINNHSSRNVKSRSIVLHPVIQTHLKMIQQVLYTTQLTQKAKKFHDGILKVLISGLRGRHVFFFLPAILYDETRTQLDSRFLKKEETVTTGESMKFDGHIVGIIELRDHKPLKDTNVDGRNCYKQNIMPSKNHNEHLAEFKKHETNMSFTKTDLKEWNVMYTTQVTQKAKKFHDGVLKLASCGSQGREEATLLAEDAKILFLTL